MLTRARRSRLWLILLIVVQGGCAIFFVSDILLTVIGVRMSPISWQSREFLEIGAAVGLFLGVVLGWVAFRRTLADKHEAEQSLRNVRMAFVDHMDKRFADWGLTPAEHEVALFSVKGLSIQDIADLRNTSEGTVKAQCNAIYRKAGVTGRAQLMSVFLDDLLDSDKEFTGTPPR
ncbi:helix-turn-helix transcriptional regulator [Shimia sp. W99]